MIPGYRRPAVWFTADWHLGHERIIELCDRPFESVAQMNDELIDNHNALVDQNDVVWMVGDMIMGDIEAGLALVSRINGRKHLICGNHDRPFEGDGTNPRKSAEWRARYLDAGFASVVTGKGMLHTRKRGGRVERAGLPIRLALGAFAQHKLIVSHFPYSGDTQGEDRYIAHRPQRPAAPDTAWLICGHVHNAWDIRVPERMINVGVDAWGFAPVPAEVITTTMEENTG